MDNSPYCDDCSSTLDGELCFFLSHPWAMLLFVFSLYFIWKNFVDPVISNCQPSTAEFRAFTRSCSSRSVSCQSSRPTNTKRNSTLNSGRKKNCTILTNCNLLPKYIINRERRSYDDVSSIKSSSSNSSVASSVSPPSSRIIRKRICNKRSIESHSKLRKSIGKKSRSSWGYIM